MPYNDDDDDNDDNDDGDDDDDDDNDDNDDDDDDDDDDDTNNKGRYEGDEGRGKLPPVEHCAKAGQKYFDEFI